MSRLVRAARLVSVATLFSRILGLGRDALRAALVGAGWLSDALNVAFKIPNLLRDLFAEGAFSGAFVPTLSRTRADEGDAAAFTLLNRVLSTMLVHVGLLVVLMVVFAPALVRLVTAPTFVAQEGVFELAVVLVRLLAPFLLFISLAVAAMGALNVFGRFFVPALSPASQNLILVAGGFVLLQIGFGRAEAAVPWACLLLVGGLLQFGMQVPALRRAGWKPRFAPDLLLRRRETREIARRMLPVVGGLAATHVCILINTWLATRQQGGDSNLYYAFRLVHLPVGLVGVAVGTAVLAEASRRAVQGDDEGVRRTLGEAQLVSLAFAAPACAGLLALGEPLARMLYLWGDMTAGEASRIGETIRYYAAAVVFYCLVKVTVPVFYARGRVRAPVVASLVAVVANLACALSLYGALQYRGLALAVACGQAANLAVLLWILSKDYGMPHRAVLGRILRIAVASVVCGLVAWAVAGRMSTDRAAGARLARGLVPVLLGGLAYFGAGWVLRSRDILSVFRSLDRR